MARRVGTCARTSGLPIYYTVWSMRPAPVLESVEALAEAGFDGVQFGAAPVDDPRRLDTLGDRQVEDLRTFLRDLGLGRSLHVISDYCFAGMASRDEAVVRRAKTCIEGAVRALSGEDLPPLVVSHDPICLPPGPEGVVAPELIVEMLQFLISLRKRYNVRPALEHWPKPQLGSPEALEPLLNAAGGGVGVLLDTGHLNIALAADWCAHATPEDFVAALPATVLEVHLHDNHGETDEHLPPGDGTADLGGMLRALAAHGFRGPVTLETDLEAPGRPGLAEGVRRARDLCVQAMAQQ